jgi:hypothetical protein
MEGFATFKTPGELVERCCANPWAFSIKTQKSGKNSRRCFIMEGIPSVRELNNRLGVIGLPIPRNVVDHPVKQGKADERGHAGSKCQSEDAAAIFCEIEICDPQPKDSRDQSGNWNVKPRYRYA